MNETQAALLDMIVRKAEQGLRGVPKAEHPERRWELMREYTPAGCFWMLAGEL